MLNNKKIKIYSALVIVLAAGFVSSCKKEFDDPSRAKSEVALGSAQAMSAVAVGVQRTYSLSRTGVMFNSVVANGFSTYEFDLINSGNIPEFQLSDGGSRVDGTNTILYNMWASAYKVIHDSDLVISGAEQLADKGYASGLIGYVSIFKAMSLGTVAQFWEKMPLASGQNATFSTNAEGYAAAISTIDKALSAIATNPISNSFLITVPSNLNIVNALHALKARYALFTGQYPLALTEANLVTPINALNEASLLRFDNTNSNILASVAISNNVFRPMNIDLGLTGAFVPDANDMRIPFYTRLATNSTTNYVLRGFASELNTGFPIFLPGEITLIKAEVYARQATPDLTNALVELNKVVTKEADALGLGADLPEITGTFTQAQLLDLIYKHRSIELYASGLKLEDTRRFNRPVSERKRNYMPYPFQERDNNPNTPADPTALQ